MRLFLVILTAFLCGLVAAVDNSKEGMMFIDSNIDVTTIKPDKKLSSKDSEASGDDDDVSGDVQGDSSGSGSGEILVTPTADSPKTKAPTTKEENVVPVVTVKKTRPTKAATKPERVIPSVKPTHEIHTEEVRKIETTTVVPIDTTVMPTTEEEEHMLGGGIEDGNIAASKQEREGLRVLTKEVIAAVIVGGICAIILIAFLVYRLRKRDEGSYVLTDSAYKDTNKLRGDPGKEAFV